MAAPLLQAQIDIDAPVAKVWTLVSDLSRMPQWSPQCRMMKALGPVRQGTRTIVEPATPRRRDGLLQHEHQRVDGRCAEFRTRTRRRHERDTVAHQGRCEELVS